MKHFTRIWQLNSFLESSPGLSAQSERFLRLHLRTLFLDFCKENDKSIWVPIVLDPENRTNSQVAQLIVLLYAPVKEQGEYYFTFYLNQKDPSDN